MAKPTLKHQTADGVVHTRKTARTYSHVIVQQTVDGKWHATNWVGRPDLIPMALAAARKYQAPEDAARVVAEAINGGVRS